MGMRILLIAALAVGCLSGCKEDNPYTSREGICTAGRDFVQQQGRLVSPASATFGDCSTSTITQLGPNRWTISSYVDDSVFNVPSRKTWSCTMRFDPATNQWAAEDTQLIDPNPPPSTDSTN